MDFLPKRTESQCRQVDQTERITFRHENNRFRLIVSMLYLMSLMLPYSWHTVL